jgi:pilus assembly protein Flp/PilA
MNFAGAGRERRDAGNHPICQYHTRSPPLAVVIFGACAAADQSTGRTIFFKAGRGFTAPINAFVTLCADIPICSGGKSFVDRGTSVKMNNRSTVMTNVFSRFVKDESGATAIEYGLIASLISIAAIAAFTAVGSKLSATFSYVAGQLNT